MQPLNLSVATRSLGGILLAAVSCLAQTDPGPRTGAAGAGGPFSALSANEKAFFSSALGAFNEVDSVSGTIAGEAGRGLGPTFNGNSCAQCHAQPAAGGTSPAPFSPQVPVPNPQVALATLHGATNTVPSFITTSGPVREGQIYCGGSDQSQLTAGRRRSWPVHD